MKTEMQAADLELGVGPATCRRRREVEALDAGELQGEARSAFEAHVAGCATCRERLAVLAADRRSLQARPELLARLEARAAPAAAPRRRWFGPQRIVGLAVAAGLALISATAFERSQRQLQPTDTEWDGRKGAVAFDLFVGGVERPRLVEGEPELRPGERIRIALTPGPHRYAVVVSVDEHGAVSPLYPVSGSSLPIPRDARPLPDSVAFDGVGQERLIAVLSDEPVSVAEVVQAAERSFSAGQRLEAMAPLGMGSLELVRQVRKPGAQ